MPKILRTTEKSPKICQKCKRELFRAGNIIISGVKYNVYTCMHCGNEVLRLAK